MGEYDGYLNGYLERDAYGCYCGNLSVEGINFSPIEGQYFKKDGETFLFIKRKPIMEYNYERECYTQREPRPQFHIYMKKQIDGDNIVAYKGTFMLMRFEFKIEGVWDAILGKDRKRMNLFVERLPNNQQKLLQSITKRRRNDK